jgi:DNA gyrase subunit B
VCLCPSCAASRVGGGGLAGTSPWSSYTPTLPDCQAGFATRVVVELQAGGWVSVQDDGRGIPTDVHPRTGKSALETVLTVLHAGGKFGGDASGYTVSGGLHGVGLSVVNALSSQLEITVWRDGAEWTQLYAKGVPQGPLVQSPTPAKGSSRGTRVRFRPDASIFSVTGMERAALASRLRELAFLNAGLTLSIGGTHEKGGAPETETFLFAGGLTEYVAYLTASGQPLHEVVSLSRRVDGVAVDVSLRWCGEGSYTDTVLGYANSIRTIDGGTHVEGLKAALTRTVNTLARQYKHLKEGDPPLSGEHLREGLTAVIAVRLPNPEFEGQTKTRLGNPEVRKAVEGAVAEELTVALEMAPATLEAIVKKALSAQRAADAAKRARDLVRRKSILRASSLPGKLADCASGSPADSEIFLVEGDSAGGSAKQGRDRQTQAVLPLRGKIINAERAADEVLYKNEEVTSLIQALGLGLRGEELDVAQLRYHRIIVLTDADVDGAHIRTLLLTFFFRYKKALFEQGHIYVGVPPLYRVTGGGAGAKGDVYCYDEGELKRHMASLGPGATPSIQRFKGLGEMMPKQLWETTLDPSTRRLRRLTIDDAARAEATVQLLMGAEVGPRREFIEREGPKLDELDI